MYFINIKKLKQEIKENKYTEKSFYQYYFWNSIASLVGVTTLSFSILNSVDIFEVIISISLVLISAIGISFAYKVHKINNKKDFVKNITAILWVRQIRSLLIASLVYLPLDLFVYFIINKPDIAEPGVFIACLIGANCLAYYKTYKDIKDLAH